MLKRTLDIGASALGLVALTPLFAFIALSIRLTSPGPVLFRQDRVGRHGQRFSIFKFRTMVHDARAEGSQFTLHRNGRVTPVGRLLRRLKLDELPQLINVIRGEMSLVGPRPEVPEYVEMFWDQYESILSVRPGITHRASIIFRNEERMLCACRDPERFYVETIMPRKLEIYAEAMHDESIVQDVRTILDTVFQVARLNSRDEIENQLLKSRTASAGGQDRVHVRRKSVALRLEA